MSRLLVCVFIVISVCCATLATADQRNDPREQALSDALDLWREGRFEQLYDVLSHRNGMTRERFASLLRDNQTKPACCYQKLNDFRLIIEKKSTAKVFARVGMDGGFGSGSNSRSKEFTLDHEAGQWRVRMSDIKALAGQGRKKK